MSLSLIGVAYLSVEQIVTVQMIYDQQSRIQHRIQHDISCHLSIAKICTKVIQMDPKINSKSFEGISLKFSPDSMCMSHSESSCVALTDSNLHNLCSEAAVCDVPKV